MGFFIGWRFFSSDQYYSEEANAERQRLADEKRRRDRTKAKKRKKRAAERAKRKAQRSSNWASSTDEYYDSVQEKYGANKGKIDHGGNQERYNQFNSKESSSLQNYAEKIEQRYSKFYNSASGAPAPKINRGFGCAPSQGIKRPRDVKHHAPLGRIGQSKRVPLEQKVKQKTSPFSSNQQGNDTSKTTNTTSTTPLKRGF